MAATHTGTGTNAGTAAAATSVTVNFPSGAQVGDLALMVLGCSTASPATPGTPAGWLVWEPWFTTTTSPNGGIGVWYRIVDGTEAASYSFTGLTSGRWSATADLYRGVDTVTPKDAANTTLTNNSGTPAHTAITTVTGGALVVGFEVNSTASGVTTTTYSSSNLTVDNSATSTAAAATNGAIGVGSLTQAVPGSVTPVLTPTGTPARGVSVSSALRPLSAPVAMRRVNRRGSRRAVLTEFRGIYAAEVPFRQPTPIAVHRRGVRRTAPRTAGNFVAPPPAQQATSPVFVPGRPRVRVRLATYAKSRIEFTPITQTVVVLPSFVPDRVRPRLRLLARLARRPMGPLPSPDVVMLEQAPRRSILAALARRSRRVEVVLPQFNPPLVPTVVARRVVRGWLARKSRRVEVVPVQQTAPVNPDLIHKASHRRTFRGWLARKAERVEVVPAQQAAPVAPTYPPQATQRRVVRGWLWRRRQQTWMASSATPVVGRTRRPVARAAVRGRRGRVAPTPHQPSPPHSVPRQSRHAPNVRRRLRNRVEQFAISLTVVAVRGYSATGFRNTSTSAAQPGDTPHSATGTRTASYAATGERDGPHSTIGG